MYLSKNVQSVTISVDPEDLYMLTLFARHYCLAKHYARSSGKRKNKVERLINKNKKVIQRIIGETLGDRLVLDTFAWEFKNREGYKGIFNKRSVHDAYDTVCRYEWYIVITSDLAKHGYGKPKKDLTPSDTTV